VNRTLVVVPVSFPVMKATSTPYLPGQLRLGDGQPLTVAPVTSVDLMARRALKDDMPGIMLRGFIRSATKAATQYALQHQSQNQNNMGLAIAALAVAIGGVVTESADERTWRTLPSEIGIARARISPGLHTISLRTPEGERSIQLNLSGRYAVVGLRLLRGQLFVMPVEAPPGGGGRQPGNTGTPPGRQLAAGRERWSRNP
jgi:uncharacterized protein